MAPSRYHKGHDVKSILLNISSNFLIVLPFLWYFDSPRIKIYAAACLIVYLIAYLAPPCGWKRPHPYSDYQENRPLTFSKNKQETPARTSQQSLSSSS